MNTVSTALAEHTARLRLTFRAHPIIVVHFRKSPVLLGHVRNKSIIKGFIMKAHRRDERVHKERITINELFQLIIVGLAILLAAFNAHAQDQHGRSSTLLREEAIRGKVVAKTADQRDEPLPGVAVALAGISLNGTLVHLITDDEGAFLFSNLAAGNYTVSINLQGFEAYEQNVAVPTGDPVDLTIELRPLALNETVTVSAESDDLEKTESTVPGMVTTSILRNAPLIGDRFQDALPLLPGVVRGPDGLLNIKGARANQSGLLVSSLNMTDPVTGNPGVKLPIEAVESIQVYANPYAAEFGRFAGAVTSIETRGGTNEWKYTVNNLLPRLRRRDGSVRGIESVTPRVAIGGPLIKDKLFVFQSFEYRFTRTEVPSLPELHNDTRVESFDSFTRLDYDINSTNRVTASFSVSPQKLDFFNLNTFNPQETSANMHQRGWFITVREQAALNNGSLLQSSFSAKQFDADVFGNSEAPFVVTPERNTGGYFNRQNRESRRYEWQEVLSLAPHEWRGQHGVKLGVNLAYTSFDGFDRSAPVRIVRADGTTSQLLTFTGDGRLRRTNTESAAFIQDKWTLHQRVTFDLGLRFDRDNMGGGNNLAPRVGFAVSPFSDARTVVRGGAGVFYDKIPLGVGVFEQQQNRTVTSFTADGVTARGASRIYRNVVEDGELHNPRSVSWNVQVDREVARRLLVRLGYEERRTTQDLIVNPELSSLDEDHLVLSNRGSSGYRELQVVTKYRWQENRDFHFAYVRSRAVGDLNDFSTYFGDQRNAVIRANERGRLSFDSPHRLLLWGEVGLPMRITALPVVEWRSGFPYSLVDENQNYVGQRNGGGRYPNFFSLDMQVMKEVRIPFGGRKIGGRVGIKVFNMTNHFNARDVQSNMASGEYGRFSNSVGRTFRLKFEFLKF